MSGNYYDRIIRILNSDFQLENRIVYVNEPFIYPRRDTNIFDQRFIRLERDLSHVENIQTELNRMRMLDVMTNLFNGYGMYDIIEEKMMNAAMNESLSYYKTQEKKPNIKLDIKCQRALPEHKNELCSICKESFEIDEKITSLECKHILHTECIAEWVKYKSECPVCRGVIKTIDTTENNEDENHEDENHE